MKTLGIILTLAAVCVIQTLSANTTTAAGGGQNGVTGDMMTQNGAAATSAPDITVTVTMTFSGTWNPTYKDMSHANTTSLAKTICDAVVAGSAKVKACTVTAFRSGSILADLSLTAASTESSTSVTNSIDATVQTSVATAVTGAGFDIGTVSGVADTTTSAPSAATTLSTSVIMYLTVLCATAKAVLF